jgi:Tfp pilus assembly protein PilF
MKLRAVLGLLAAAVAVAAILIFTLYVRPHNQTIRQAQVHLQKGIDLYNKKVYIHAEQELRKALRANRKDWKAPFYMASVMVQTKRYGFAVLYLERALTLNPGEIKILNAFGVVYVKLGKLDMAKGYFAAALDINPADKQAKDLMGTMAKLQRRARQTATSAEE